MALIGLSLVGLLVGSISASITERNHALSDVNRNTAINKLPISKLNRAHSEHIHEVMFMIKQKNIDELERQLLLVSDPSSSSYLKFWTADEIANLCGNEKGRNQLMKYLSDKGVTSFTETLNGEIILARSKIIVWENMFQTEFYEFEHTSTKVFFGKQTNSYKKHFVRAESYEIPRDLEDAVESVLGIIEVPIYKQSDPMLSPIDNLFFNDEDPFTAIEGANTRSRKLVEERSMNPNALRAYYNISAGLTGSHEATQAVYSFPGYSMSLSDLALFQRIYTPNFVQPVNLTTKNIILNNTYCAVDYWNCGRYFAYFTLNFL